MVRVSVNQSFEALKVLGLARERCRVVGESRARVYLRLSAIPPFGWSYIFSNLWVTAQFGQRPMVGVEEDAVWMDVPLEEVCTRHLEALEQAVAQANAEYWAWVTEQRAVFQNCNSAEEQLRSRMDELDQACHPAPTPVEEPEAVQSVPRIGFIAMLRRFFLPGRCQSC